MIQEINPFQQLYVTERAAPNEFVQFFAPSLVENAQQLFQPGNIVLQGMQGCGKTTLLTLLKPEIRVAYAKAREDFPLPPQLKNFISAGINLKRSDALGLGQRPIVDSINSDLQIFPLYFADFINYWVVNDLFNNLITSKDNYEYFSSFICFDNIDAFAKELSTEDCWFGYLNGYDEFDSVHARLKERIGAYRSYHQYNIDVLPDSINTSKTNIGEPISRAAKLLKKHGIITEDTNVIIRIDQLEEILETDELRPDLQNDYRSIINKAIGSRDPQISYKIGVRSYAWKRNVRIFRTNTNIEERRDYVILDFDSFLKRRENRSGWIFPIFAQQVFIRRLRAAGYDVSTNHTTAQKTFSYIFGPGMGPETSASHYCQNITSPHKVLNIKEDTHSKEWIAFLTSEFQRNPLEAKLASAWALQGKNGKRLCKPVPSSPYPWNKTYWRKERVKQALMQLAGSCQQSMIWGGAQQTIALSTSGILVFLSACQYVWDSFLRSERTNTKQDENDYTLKEIPLPIQSMGIESVSRHWYEKISELPGGHLRTRFVDIISRLFRIELMSDTKMSYPGHNGFSILNTDLANNPDIKDFLKECVDFAVLFESPHTTKSSDKRPRTKWYLNPILCPYFKVHESRIKEPIYVTIDVLRKWYDAAVINEKITEDLLERRLHRKKMKPITYHEQQAKLPL